MFNLFKQPHRRWILEYTFLNVGIEVNERDRFLTQQEAEERFHRMHEYHRLRNQQVIRATLTNPTGTKQNLIETVVPYGNWAITDDEAQPNGVTCAVPQI